MEHSDQEEIMCESEDAYHEINKQFLRLVTSVIFTEEGSSVSQLRIFFGEYISKFEEHNPEIASTLSKLKEAKTVADVHATVEKYYSFYNYEVIEELVKTHGSDDDKLKHR